jgi:hypothetical protein
MDNNAEEVWKFARKRCIVTSKTLSASKPQSGALYFVTSNDIFNKEIHINTSRIYLLAIFVSTVPWLE